MKQFTVTFEHGCCLGYGENAEEAAAQARAHMAEAFARFDPPFNRRVDELGAITAVEFMREVTW